jgi:DNA polymerase-3 subunit delta
MLIQELDRQISKNELKNLYLFSGEETFEKDEYIRKIKKCIGELVKGINLIIIDKENIGMLEQELSTYPFGYDKKLIIVNVPTKERKNKKDDDNDESNEIKQDKRDWLTNDIIDILSGNLDNIYVIFNDDESSAKSKLAKLIEEKGVYVEFEKKKSPELIKWAIEICSKYNITLSRDEATYIIHLCGGEKQTLINELRKLIEYTGNGGTINRECIDKLCIKTDDVIVFNLTDSMGRRDTKESLKFLDELVENKEAVQKIIILIARHFNNLLMTKEILKQNKSLEVELGLKPYPALKCKEQSKNFVESYLIRIIKELAKLDSDSKVGKIDVMIGLQKIICI